MQRIDGFYLYQLGHRLHRLSEVRAKLWDGDTFAVKKRHVVPELKQAEMALGQFLFSSVFELKVAATPGQALLAALNDLIKVCEGCDDDNEYLEFLEYSPVREAFNEFEAVLKAELSKTGMFLVASKNAMDTLTLIEAGHEAFPLSLMDKVPEAIPDVRQAMSCIAFELPTASAFHLHRANEAVLKKYWIAHANGKGLPERSTMGQIVEAMEREKIGKEEIRVASTDVV